MSSGAGTTSDGQWCVRKTFVVVDEEEQSESPPRRRARSEPPAACEAKNCFCQLKNDQLLAPTPG